MTVQPARYALYYAPEADTPLWRFGSSVVGYDAVTGEDKSVPDFAGLLAERWLDLTSEPRKYGFHATLKAPFFLAVGVDEEALKVALQRFAEKTPAVATVGLDVSPIGPFLALTPLGDANEINALASLVVNHFDAFRAPLSTADRERRLKSPLTSRQTDYLDRFGYPYVHEEFRFHMTLTGPLHADDRGAMRKTLADAYSVEAAPGTLTIDRICLFRQETPAARFRIIDSVRLT